MKTKEELGKMAEEHWNWVNDLLKTLTPDTVLTVETVQYLYKTALIHGYGHAVVDFVGEKNADFSPLIMGMKYD